MVVARTIGGGDIAFLTGHAPFVGALDIYPAKIYAEDGGVTIIAVHGGFVEVANDHVSILSDVAELAGDIDVPPGRGRPGRRRGSAAPRRRRRGRGRPRRAEVRLEVAGGALVAGH